MRNPPKIKSLQLLLFLATLAAVSASAQPAGGGTGQPGINPQLQPGQPGRPGGPARGGGRGAPARGAGPGIQQGVVGRVSPHETISANINNRVISITYGRPYSKDPASSEIRKIWGTLVPWNAAWRLGADEATLLLTPVDLLFGNVTIPAGSYTLYMMPMESGTSQLVFSKNVGKWGIPVDTATDIAKVDLRKSELNPPNQQLLLAFEAAATATPANPAVTLKIMWESTQYSADFTAK